MVFRVGDTVKCFWHAQVYQAKIVDYDSTRKKGAFLVHYQGWNSRWNEWVPDKRLTKGDTKPSLKPTRVRKPKPDLRKIGDETAVIYVSDDGDNLESLCEVRAYCMNNDYQFVASDYDFNTTVVVQNNNSKLNNSHANSSKTAANKKKLSSATKEKIKVKITSRVKSKPIKEELKEIRRSLDNYGPSTSQSQNIELSTEEPVRKSRKAYISSPKKNTPKPRPSANATVQLLMSPTNMKNEGPMLNQTREHSVAPSFEGLQDSLDRANERIGFDDVLLNASSSSAGENQTATEFIEIQAANSDLDVDIPRLSPAHAKSSLDAEEDSLNVDSNLDESLGLGCMVGAAFSKINFTVNTRTNLMGTSTRLPERPPHLRGMKVYASEPESHPARVILKLAPPPVKTSNSSRNMQYMPYDGVQYMDNNYSPQLHVGGRGRFGVLGEGPPPLPVMADHAEDFCRLPPQINSDHSYGKSAPPPGSVQFSNPVRIPHQFLPTAVVSSQPHRVQNATGLSPIKKGKNIAHLLNNNPPPHLLRLQRSPSPLGYQDQTMYVDDEFYEGYNTHSQNHQHNLGPSLSLMTHGQTLMLDERLPANILEDIDTDDHIPIN